MTSLFDFLMLVVEGLRPERGENVGRASVEDDLRTDGVQPKIVALR